MVLPASDMFPPADALQEDETYYEFPDSDHPFLSMERPKMLVKKEDSLQQEKQISVDPISLIVETAYPHLGLPPPSPSPSPPPKVSAMSLPLPLLPPPEKTKFLSTSLPRSTTSSPRVLSSSMLKKKKKWKNQGQGQLPSPLAMDPHLSRQHSVALTRLAQLKESHLRRSKSCGEGRATAPSDDFDLWSAIKAKANGSVEHDGGSSSSKHISSFHKTETKTHDGHKSSGEGMDYPYDEKFKCGALCLFLPGFGRGKPVRPRIKEEIMGKEMAHVISRTVSLEKFECGSWTSSAIVMQNEDQEKGDSTNLFFDLPLELIRNSVNDADSPVTAAFVFDDKDHRRGVLKCSSSSRATARKSHDSSSRHVRFSTSSSSPRSNPTSPTACITPRLRKAKEDFNAFLEAQSA